MREHLGSAPSLGPRKERISRKRVWSVTGKPEVEEVGAEDGPSSVMGSRLPLQVGVLA